MKIQYANDADYDYIKEHDRHVLESLIARKIKENEIFIIRDQQNVNMGWLRYGYFWDSIPFLNMIWLDEQYRGKGAGKEAVLFWEQRMKERGSGKVMTSTLANEQAQHFYRKLGYKDSGCLLLENEPLEILLVKSI
ncbi:GNAT family N-acetyltransferase [Paenibacillus sp. 32352]|uniref:GNAT family N-acetyltransferase n=1 Tax=Paenibacillus sp. 32352 TaxID=1969111 RepID=UPI0009AC69BC|nr:GNAT family N-acetyltransferase [Paenibacillus sp. 32352]